MRINSGYQPESELGCQVGRNTTSTAQRQHIQHARFYTHCRAFQLLHGKDGEPKYPLVYLTNSGQQPAPDRAASLAQRFGVSVRPEQIVQCHTPLRLGLAAELADEPVLLVGRGDVKRVGESYGLQRCLTVEELALAAPASVPFAGHIRRRADEGRLAGAAGDAAALEARTNGRPFAAILVLNDPEDWYSALQISLDVVLGRGRPGVRAPRDDAADPVHVVL